MSKKKKLLLPFVVLLAICIVFGAIAVIVKKVNAKTISVVPVSELMSQYDYFGTGTQETISGTITTHVTQKIRLDTDSIVAEVNVNVGDRVSEGDQLMSYDTTLTELELQIQKLTKENNERKLEKAKERLNSLENGGPVEDSDTDTDALSSPSDEKDDNDGDSEPGDEAGLENKAINVMRVAAFRAIGVSGQDPAPETPGETQAPPADVTETPQETPDVTETPPVTPTPEPTETPQENDGLTASAVLDDTSVPYMGTGTVEDPFRFLCDQNEEYIIVRGTFLNKMSGYDAQGEVKESEDGPFWYRLEFHEDNKVADLLKPEDSLIGYYVRKGAAEPTDPEDEKHFSVEGAIIPGDDVAVLTPTPTETPDDSDTDFDDWDDWDDSDDDTDEGTMTREEAIKAQKSTITSLELEIRSNAIQISKLEKKLKNQVVVAAIDGVVKVVGDPISGESDGDAFIEVYSDDGFYVQGTISELMLNKIDVGQLLNVQAWESGLMFQAEIKEISQFPASSSAYYGNSNPNVSYYPFIAKVMGDQKLRNGESVDMTLELNEEEDSGGIKIDVAFVKTEDGQSFVYKESDGRLKKQIVEMTKLSDGYTEVANVTSGLSEEDKIAFPYAKSAVEGAKTKEGTLDEVYGYN